MDNYRNPLFGFNGLFTPSERVAANVATCVKLGKEYINFNFTFKPSDVAKELPLAYGSQTHFPNGNSLAWCE